MEATQALEDILPASERTKTIDVIERIVAENKEVEKLSTVFVRPLPFRRWLTAMQHISRVLQHFPEYGLSFDNDAALAVSLVYLLGEAQEDLIALASLATDKEAGFF